MYNSAFLTIKFSFFPLCLSLTPKYATEIDVCVKFSARVYIIMIKTPHWFTIWSTLSSHKVPSGETCRFKKRIAHLWPLSYCKFGKVDIFRPSTLESHRFLNPSDPDVLFCTWALGVLDLAHPFKINVYLAFTTEKWTECIFEWKNNH